MQNDFSEIIKAFEKNGVDVASAAYSFTAYSLNTPLSFRFENLAAFLLFLNVSADKQGQVKQMLTDAGLEPDKFFFVNFFKPKVAEI
ncbi:hypothetical protein AM493_04595 [Flavobacterium akiainvivens]|uniref:Uncharacterized protein n=1 Tax=Flavobacterium akiainvivens TaxID=1202724 RepID=A0A0M8MFV0_9FLAO|nr:hypothetical protein [Flavobacterium akiainvivens]KOS05391.1 hypothetical protein AM493_04595 [Flavobacterium akiainvivens]SFQ73742.1 hypothetical protein SAMN05444144_11931 [Flavobacterium akiainvivens]